MDLMEPTIDAMRLMAAMERKGVSHHPAARDMPRWASAALTYDVDGVLLLEVRVWEPHRNPVPILSTLADDLAELGWRQLGTGGPLPHIRPDGVTCAGAWLTWTREVTS